MNQKVKALGLALVAVLALSGIVATSARASTPILSEAKWPQVTTVDVTDTSGTSHGTLARLTIGTGARYIECTTATLKAAFIESTTTVAATPTWEQCFSNGLTTAPAQVTHNGCTLALTATGKFEELTRGDATACSGGGQIEIHVFENEKAQKENKPLCTYDIKSQTVTGATVFELGGGGLPISLESLSKVKLTNTGAGGLAVCGIAANKEGEASFKGSLLAVGTTLPGAFIGIKLG